MKKKTKKKRKAKKQNKKKNDNIILRVDIFKLYKMIVLYSSRQKFKEIIYESLLSKRIVFRS